MRMKALGLATLLALGLAGPAAAQETPRMGGVLKVAAIGEPPTLDIPSSTATLVYEIMWHVNEGLFTYDKGFNPTPMLAESHAVSDKARQLLKDASYGGQPIRWVTTKEYEFMYNNALVAKQQLEAVGFVIDLQVTDWASVNHRTEKQPDAWEVFSTGFVFSADPANHVSLRCTFQGWWCNEEKERLLAELQVETDVRKRKAIVDRIQTVFYEDVGQVKLGDYFTLDVARRDLRGDFRTAPRMYFWNSWLAR